MFHQPPCRNVTASPRHPTHSETATANSLHQSPNAPSV
ncbi:hypothetical protein BH23VER1_BH23VER1_12410 [soil metagenome]